MIKFINTGANAEIEISGEIGNSFWSDGWTVDRFTNELKSIDAPTVTIKLNSKGGDVLEAFAIYDAIKATKKRVICQIIGSSASAATVFASASDSVMISENSRYLVHNAMTFVEGNKESLKDAYEQLLSIDNQILDIYVKRTGKSKDLLANLMTEERWMTAQEALDWGFVDEIIKPEKVFTNLITNIMSEEEIAALQAENEALKAKVEELAGKLAEYETAQEEQMDAEIDAVIDEAETAGKITNEARDTYKAFAKANGKQAIVNMFAAIKVAPVVVDLSKVVDKSADAPEPMTPEKWRSNFKSNVYVNRMDVCRADYKTAFGKELSI